MIFSELALRLPSGQNALYAARDRLLSEGKTIIDLVSGNATACGFNFPQALLQKAVGNAIAQNMVYTPDPFGNFSARESISAYYGGRIPASQIVLTPGTSLSYLYCFKLLAEPGEEILCPRPGYPLLDHIADLCGLRLKYYLLNRDKRPSPVNASGVGGHEPSGAEFDRWSIDFEQMEAGITSKTRAIVLISPHNPTGMVCRGDVLKRLSELAGKYELPIIADEVFSDFVFDGLPFERVCEYGAPLVFTLNGLSKMLALPGLKLGWIGVSGEESYLRRSLSALELTSDTFLPVSEIVQGAASELLGARAAFSNNYADWLACRRNLSWQLLGGLDLALPQAGFCLLVPLRQKSEALAQELLERELILVHPSHFYDLESEHLIISYVQTEAALKNSLPIIKEYVEAGLPAWSGG